MLYVWVGLRVRDRRDRRQLHQRLRRPAALREEHPLARLALRPLLPADSRPRQHPPPRLLAAPRPLPDLRPAVFRQLLPRRAVHRLRLRRPLLSRNRLQRPRPALPAQTQASSTSSGAWSPGRRGWCSSGTRRSSASSSRRRLCDLQYMEVPLGVTVCGTLVGLVGATRSWPGRSRRRPAPVPPAPGWAAAVHRAGAVPVAGLAAEAAAGLAAARRSWQLGLATGLAGVLAGMVTLRGVRFLFGLGRGKEGLGHRRRRRDDDGRQLPRLAADADRLLRRRLRRPVFRRRPAHPPRRPGAGRSAPPWPSAS